MKLTVNLEESSSDEELKKLEKEWEDEDGWRPDLRKESQQLMLLLDSEWWKRKMEAPWAVPAAPAASSAEEPQQNPQQHQQHRQQQQQHSSGSGQCMPRLRSSNDDKSGIYEEVD